MPRDRRRGPRRGLGRTCGACRYGRSGHENLCGAARFTGYHLDGGYAELAVADERFCFALPEGFSDEPPREELDAAPVGALVPRPSAPSRAAARSSVAASR